MAATESAQQCFDDLAIWRTSLPDVEHGLLPAHSDRPNPKLNDGMLFVSVFSPGCVYALDATTGEVCWRRELNYLGGSSVELSKGRLFAKTARTLYALDPASGSILWEFCPYGLEGETLYTEPVVDGNRLFVGDRRGWLHCLNIETGETIWKQEVSDGPNRNVNATAAVVAGMVITGTNAGFAVAYAVEDGRPVWQGKLDGPCTNHLFLVGKQLIVAAESLHLFDPLTGESQGRVNWPGFFVSFAAGTPSIVVLFISSLLAGWETGEPVERESEILFVFEGTRLVREMRCSRYA
jgi:hypothetical protein